MNALHKYIRTNKIYKFRLEYPLYKSGLSSSDNSALLFTAVKFCRYDLVNYLLSHSSLRMDYIQDEQTILDCIMLKMDKGDYDDSILPLLILHGFRCYDRMIFIRKDKVEILKLLVYLNPNLIILDVAYIRDIILNKAENCLIYLMSIFSVGMFKIFPTILLFYINQTLPINFRVVRELLKYVNINEQNLHNGETALHIAAKKRNYNLIKMLLEHDADPHILDSQNRTAYTIMVVPPSASFYQCENIIKCRELIESYSFSFIKGTDNST
jgi:hypothetical protein